MNFLICGLGSIGKRHFNILKSFGGNSLVAYRSSKNLKSEEGVEEIFDLGKISEKQFDAALITNPTSLHVSTAIEIAKNGIPLFIEKPLGKNLDRIGELENLVEEKNIPVLMGYNLLYHPGIVTMKKLIADNVIGKIISAKAQFGTYMPDWHKGEDHKKSYAASPELGGGVVLTSIHEQNYLTGMFGKVTEVKAMEVGNGVIGISSEEGVEILMKHSSGVVSNVHLNFFQKPYYRTCEIIGTEGTIFWNFMKPEVKILYKDKTETIKLGNYPAELLEKSYVNQMKHFVEVAQRSEQPLATLQNGIDDLRVALQILTEIRRN